VEQNLEYLRVLGVQPTATRVSFLFSAADAEAARLRLAEAGLEPGRFFQAHVTSRWMFKTMPPATAARLLELLRERSGLPFLLTAAPEPRELDYLAELQRHLATGPAPVFSDLRLKELGALSASARFFAGVDSAPMHMAAALDVPVLGLFGPSSAQVWGPWDNRLGRNPYQAARGVQQGGRHTVLQSAAPCVPCLRDGCNGSKRSDCLDFSPEQLVSVVNDFVTMKVGL
jgi:heptosyltransferase-3